MPHFSPHQSQRLGVSVVVTDDLASFRSVAEKLGPAQQVCGMAVGTKVSVAFSTMVGAGVAAGAHAPNASAATIIR